MRRPGAITLVLMGGAVLTLGACESEEARCRRARLEGRPNAEAICAASGRGSSSSSWFGWSSSSGSGTTGATAGTSTSSSRGGFGSTASSAGG